MGAVHVLVVCTGNICRSPMAEVVLRDRFEQAGLGGQVTVESAAVSSEEVGNPIDGRAQRVLANNGYEVPHRQAQQVTVRQLQDTDLVLAMTAQHARALRRLLGDDPASTRTGASSVVMYRSFDQDAPEISDVGEEHRLDVDDPWYHDEEAFEVCLEQIEAAAEGIVEWVRDHIAS